DLLVLPFADGRRPLSRVLTLSRENACLRACYSWKAEAGNVNRILHLGASRRMFTRWRQTPVQPASQPATPQDPMPSPGSGRAPAGGEESGRVSEASPRTTASATAPGSRSAPAAVEIRNPALTSPGV